MEHYNISVIIIKSFITFLHNKMKFFYFIDNITASAEPICTNADSEELCKLTAAWEYISEQHDGPDEVIGAFIENVI